MSDYRMILDAFGEGLDQLGRFVAAGGWDIPSIQPIMEEQAIQERQERQEAIQERREKIRAKKAAIRAAMAAVGGDPDLVEARPDENDIDWIVRLIDHHHQRYTVMVTMSDSGGVQMTRVYDLP